MKTIIQIFFLDLQVILDLLALEAVEEVVSLARLDRQEQMVRLTGEGITTLPLSILQMMVFPLVDKPTFL
jgi:hypothetical protein